MEISSSLSEISSGVIENQSLMSPEGSKLFSSETLYSVTSEVQNIAKVAFQRIALVWSNISQGVTQIFRHGAEEFQLSESKLEGSGHLFLSIPASILYSLPAGMMGLCGMDIKPYLTEY